LWFFALNDALTDGIKRSVHSPLSEEVLNGIKLRFTESRSHRSRPQFIEDFLFIRTALHICRLRLSEKEFRFVQSIMHGAEMANAQ
jgi:hypothetical protein